MGRKDDWISGLRNKIGDKNESWDKNTQQYYETLNAQIENVSEAVEEHNKYKKVKSDYLEAVKRFEEVKKTFKQAEKDYAPYKKKKEQATKIIDSTINKFLNSKLKWEKINLSSPAKKKKSSSKKDKIVKE